MIKNIITHAGIHHADDAFATSVLRIIWPNTPVLRKNPTPGELEDPDTVVLDIGGIYDPSTNCFDHHHPIGSTGDKTPRPYHQRQGLMASFGLVWSEYGIQAVQKQFPEVTPQDCDLIWNRVTNTLVRSVDEEDTGTSRDGYTVSRLISCYNTGPREQANARFLEAVETAKMILIKEMESQREYAANTQGIKQAMEQTECPHTLIMETCVPWKSTAREFPDLWFAVYPSAREGWCVECCPPPNERMAQKVPLPEWLATDKEQRDALGFGIIFAHTARFIAVCDTRENALHLNRWLVKTQKELLKQKTCV